MLRFERLKARNSGATTVTASRSCPELVTGHRVLDLYDVGAEVGELLRAERPGDDAREIEDADAGERGVRRDRAKLTRRRAAALIAL